MTGSPVAPHASSPVELQQRIEAERRGVPFLVYRDGNGHQQIVDLAGRQRLTVGRLPENDVPLSWDRGVSRVHAEIEPIGAEWTVSDDGLSQNGSFINASRVVGKRRLRDGDKLRFGQTIVVFSSPVERLSEPTSALASTVPDAASLSERQREVLIALCRPFDSSSSFATPATNQQIANELYMSVDAVKTNLRALFAKFGVADLPQNQKRAQLMWRAFQTGVVTARDLWPES